MQQALLDVFREETRQLSHVSGLEARLFIQPLHEASIDAMKLRGGNPVGVEANGPLTGKSNRTRCNSVKEEKW